MHIRQEQMIAVQISMSDQRTTSILSPIIDKD